jgi:hypothetical protein
LERGEAICGVALSAKEAMKRHGRVHSILTFLSAHRADLAVEEWKTEQIQSLSQLLRPARTGTFRDSPPKP